jgi:4-amino-4-deoxy-L-arabinose transferase-like glycosyltransferase
VSSAGRLSADARIGLALASLHLFLGFLLYDPTLFPGGDNAGYMILGEALASGQGYRDIYLPLGPLHTKYPPLYPLLLAVFTPLASLQLLKLTSLVLTTLAVWLTYRLADQLVGRGPAVVAAGLLAISPVLLEYSHFVLSEALFVVLVVTSLLWIERSAQGSTGEEGQHRIAPALLLGLAAAGAAFLTRTAGLPLLAAAVLFFALERKPRRFSLATAVASASAGGWWLYQRWASAAPGADVSQPTYLKEMMLRNPYDPAAGSAGPGDLAVRSIENLWSYASEILPRSLAGGWGSVPGGEGVLTALGLAIAGLAFVGWVRRSMSRLGPAELFTVLYAIMLALWPPVWTDQRFLLPLLPLLLAYAASGASELGRRLSAGREGARAPALAMGALVSAVGIGAAITTVARTPESIRCLADYRAGAPCDPPEFASFYAAAEWAATSTPPNAIAVSRKPRIFFWISGRRGDLYPYSTDTRVVLEGIKRIGADYVVVDAISGTTSRYLVPALRENLPMFEIVYEGGDPPTFVLSFDPAPVAAD